MYCKISHFTNGILKLSNIYLATNILINSISMVMISRYDGSPSTSRLLVTAQSLVYGRV